MYTQWLDNPHNALWESCAEWKQIQTSPSLLHKFTVLAEARIYYLIMKRTLSKEVGTKVTKATISNTLRRQGLKSCSARRVPLLKPVHVQARLKFAREHLDDPEEDWGDVIRSDETKTNFLVKV